MYYIIIINNNGIIWPTLLNFFNLGASRRTWSQVGAGWVPGVRLTPSRLRWSQLSGVGLNLESAVGTGANLEEPPTPAYGEYSTGIRE